MIARLKKYGDAQRQRAAFKRREKKLLGQIFELLKEVAPYRLANSVEEDWLSLLESLVVIMKEKKAAIDTARAHQQMQGLIQNPQTSRPSREQACQN